MKFYFEVANNLEALDQVFAYYDRINQPWIPRDDWWQCRLALAEGFTNAVRHANKGLPSDIQIVIEGQLDRQGMELKIWDDGPPFDLESFVKTIRAKMEANWSDHGRGIPILLKIADRLSYVRVENQRNYLLIVKHFSLDEDYKDSNESVK